MADARDLDAVHEHLADTMLALRALVTSETSQDDAVTSRSMARLLTKA